MKNVKINILFMVLLLSPLCATWGQSRIDAVPANITDTTIVRYWQDSVSIVYADKANNDRHFLLVNQLSPVVLRIAVPEHFMVNDFRILHDTVFLCGCYYAAPGTLQGLLACFAIQDFYSGSGNYQILTTNPSHMPDCLTGSCKNHVYDITRMAVYDSSGHSRIGFIAKNRILGDTTRRTGIGWAAYGGGTTWDIRIIYNKDAIEEFTDITTTDGYVVAVGRNNQNGHLALRIFPKSDFIIKTPIVSPGVSGFYYYNQYGQGYSDLKVDKNVMATAMDGDKFAVAYHYMDLPQEGLAVKTFGIWGGVASMMQGTNVPDIRLPGSVWKMRDVRYCRLLQRLVVLNDFDGGTVGGQASIVYQFQIPMPATGIYQGTYMSGYVLHALDSSDANAKSFIASGNAMAGGQLTLYSEALLTSLSCGIRDEIGGSLTFATPYATYMETNINEPRFNSLSTSFVVEVVDAAKLCDTKP